MSRSKPIEIFTPPNALKAKVGGSLSPMDRSAIAKAEKALQDLSGEFQNWIEDELTRLDEAWAKYESEDNKIDAINAVHAVSHDLKGLAKTYEYPLVGRMASLLCRLTNDDVDRAKAPAVLIKGHIDGIRAAIKGHIKTEDHPIGSKLVEELEVRVGEFEAKNTLPSQDKDEE